MAFLISFCTDDHQYRITVPDNIDRLIRLSTKCRHLSCIFQFLDCDCLRDRCKFFPDIKSAVLGAITQVLIKKRSIHNNHFRRPVTGNKNGFSALLAKLNNPCCVFQHRERNKFRHNNCLLFCFILALFWRHLFFQKESTHLMDNTISECFRHLGLVYVISSCFQHIFNGNSIPFCRIVQ